MTPMGPGIVWMNFVLPVPVSPSFVMKRRRVDEPGMTKPRRVRMSGTPAMGAVGVIEGAAAEASEPGVMMADGRGAVEASGGRTMGDGDGAPGGGGWIG